MVAGRFKVAVVGTVLLLAVDQDLGGVHVRYDASGGIHGFYPADEFAVDARQPGEVLLCRQHLGLEGLQPRGQRRSAAPDLLRANQPEGWVL